MRKAHLIFILILQISSFSNAQSWQWAKSVGGWNDDVGGIAVESSGISYIAGKFAGQCYFQTDTLYTWNNAHGLFIMKLDAQGNELWVKQLGGVSSIGNLDNISQVVVDEDNSAMYISGRFDGILSIDGCSLTAPTYDYFLCKLDLNGVCQWLIKAGSPIDDIGFNHVTIDQNGNLYYTAHLKAAGSIDTFSLNRGSFLAKISSAGQIQWARDEFVDIDPYMKIDNGRLCFTGIVRNDTSKVDTTTLFIINYPSGIFGELDSNGNLVWLNAPQSTQSSYFTSVDFDNNGNLYICGNFEDSLLIGNQQLVALGFKDGFIGKFSNAGNLIWVRQSNAASMSTASTYFKTLTTDEDGNIYITGDFNIGTQIGPYSLTASTSSDVLIGRIDKDGNWLGVVSFGQGYGQQLREASSGDFFIIGKFNNTLSLGSTNLTSVGGSDIYIARSTEIMGLANSNRIGNNQLRIYANPNKGSFRIMVPETISQYEEATLFIFDESGKILYDFNVLLNNGEHPLLNLLDINSGGYLVKLSQGNQSFFGKMLVE